MGPLIALFCLGCLLIPGGALLMIVDIPVTSRGVSWNEFKRACGIMIHRRRFQVGLVCVAVGLLILLGIFKMLLP